MTRSGYELTIADIREIAATSGIAHAEFCVEQTETQLGGDYTAPLKAEIARLLVSENGVTQMDLFARIVDGLRDNARVNSVSISDGWTSECAIETYLTEAEIQALTASEYASLNDRVADYLAEAATSSRADFE